MTNKQKDEMEEKQIRKATKTSVTGATTGGQVGTTTLEAVGLQLGLEIGVAEQPTKMAVMSQVRPDTQH